MKTHNTFKGSLETLEADIKHEASMRYFEAKKRNLTVQRKDDTIEEVSKELDKLDVYEKLEFLREVEEKVKKY